MLRIDADYASTSNPQRPLYTQLIGITNTIAGSISPGFEVWVKNGSNYVGVVQDNVAAARTFIPMGQFFEVVVTKTGTSGTTADTVKYEVYDATGTNLLNSTTRLFTFDVGYGNLGHEIDFGNFSGNPTGTFELQWATFGIGEAAPFIPEPSAALLVAVGGLVVCWRRRRA
jgi:hypothetical protein